MKNNKKILFIIILINCVPPGQSLFAQSNSEFGLGLAVPDIGIQAAYTYKNIIVDFSMSYSSLVLADAGDKPDKIKPIELFFNYITSARTNKWSPIIGVGGIYMPYRKTAQFINEEGAIFALGLNLGTYSKINEYYKFFIEFSIGVPLTNNVTSDNPFIDIKPIVFVPKIGLMYFIK